MVGSNREGYGWHVVRQSQGVALQNRWECVETRIEVGTAGLDSDIVGGGKR